ncbi:MAG: DUF1759 domain-containing protein, partial [Sulfitobacter sp.]|nr:DUF1759 domain-containing protein [Sulfitobacter sp.]
MAPPTGRGAHEDAIAQTKALLVQRKADAAENVLTWLESVREAARTQPGEPQEIIALTDEMEAHFERFRRLHGEYSELEWSENEAAQADQDRSRLSGMWREALTARCRARRGIDLSNSTTPGGTNTGTRGGCLVKPPRLPLPKFGGSLLEYSRWTSLFRAVLDSAPLSEDQKLVFLAAALFGDAKDTVDGPISGGASYQECMALLEARYGDKERRIRAIATAMKNWPKMGSFRVPEVRKHRARCTEHLAM